VIPGKSLEERYGNHSGYVCAVSQAANRRDRAALPVLTSDATVLIADATNSNVLTTGFTPTAADTGIANNIECGLSRTHNFNWRRQ